MILLENGTNIFALTLSEKTTISEPTYLLSFENQMTGEVINFISSDTSSYKKRYNLLSVELVAAKEDESPVDAKIFLEKTGYYNYKAYAQTDTGNLDPALANELVEQGKVLYGFEQTATPSFKAERVLKSYGKQ